MHGRLDGDPAPARASSTQEPRASGRSWRACRLIREPRCGCIDDDKATWHRSVTTHSHPSITPRWTTRHWWRLAQGGHREAFRHIMQRCNQRLFRVARGVINDDAEAEDVVQEAYVHAFEKLATFRGEAALLTWLTRIVLNEALRPAAATAPHRRHRPDRGGAGR